MKAFKIDDGFVQSLKEKEEARSAKITQVVEAVEEITETQKNVWRRSQVVEKVRSMYQTKVSDSFVSNVLKHILEMRYRKVKRIPFQGNSDRCMILRQQYAKFMLELLDGNKRVLNLDETWLN